MNVRGHPEVQQGTGLSGSLDCECCGSPALLLCDNSARTALELPSAQAFSLSAFQPRSEGQVTEAASMI